MNGMKLFGRAMTALFLLTAAASQATVMVEVNRHDYDNVSFYGYPIMGGDWSVGWGWGTHRYVDSVGFSREGRVCRRASGLNWGFGHIVLNDARTPANTTYRIVFWVRNEDDINGRVFMEFAQNEAGCCGTGDQQRAWPRNAWVKDSIDYKTPAAIANANAILISVVCLDNEKQNLSTTPAHGYLDEMVTYRVAPDGPYPPVIVTVASHTRNGQPRDTTVAAGAHALFRVEAVGKAPLSYRWYRNDQPMDGEISRNLWIRGAKAEDNGARYKCTVTNPDGSVTSDVAVLHLTGITGAAAGRVAAVIPGRISVFGAAAHMQLAEAQAWTVELRTLGGALVHSASGFGATASIGLPASRGVLVAHVTAGTSRFSCSLISGR